MPHVVKQSTHSAFTNDNSWNSKKFQNLIFIQSTSNPTLNKYLFLCKNQCIKYKTGGMFMCHSKCCLHCSTVVVWELIWVSGIVHSFIQGISSQEPQDKLEQLIPEQHGFEQAWSKPIHGYFSIVNTVVHSLWLVKPKNTEKPSIENYGLTTPTNCCLRISCTVSRTLGVFSNKKFKVFFVKLPFRQNIPKFKEVQLLS